VSADDLGDELPIGLPSTELDRLGIDLEDESNGMGVAIAPCWSVRDEGAVDIPQEAGFEEVSSHARILA